MRLSKIQPVCDVMPSRFVTIHQRLLDHSAFIFKVNYFKNSGLDFGKFGPEEGGSTILRNVDDIY